MLSKKEYAFMLSLFIINGLFLGLALGYFLNGGISTIFWIFLGVSFLTSLSVMYFFAEKSRDLYNRLP